MKKVLALILIFSTLLQASKILSHNIYERTDRVDIMITFDTPYEGTLYQNIKDDFIKLTLQGATVEDPVSKPLSNPFLTSLMITPIGDHAEVILNTPSLTNLSASKTIDGYGLRLRLTKEMPVSQSNVKQNSVSEESLPTQKRDSTVQISAQYYLIIGLLIIAVIALYFLRRKMPTSKKGSWLMGSGGKSLASSGADIIFQKPLDANNRVVLIEFEKRRYLAITGNSNVLLDTYTTDNTPATTQEQFNHMLSKNSAKLEEFLNVSGSLENYKEKAGAI